MSKKQTLYPTPSSLPWIIQSFPVSCPQKSYMQRGTTAEQPTVSLLIVANTVMSHFPSLSDSFLSFLTLAAWGLYLKWLFGTTDEIYQFILNLRGFHDAVSTAAAETSSYLGKKLPEQDFRMRLERRTRWGSGTVSPE